MKRIPPERNMTVIHTIVCGLVPRILPRPFIFEGEVPANQKHAQHLHKLGQGPSVSIIPRIIPLCSVTVLHSARVLCKTQGCLKNEGSLC